MDQHRFETLTRSLTSVPSRRALLRSFAGAGFGWGVARLPDLAEAKKRKRKSKSREGLCRQDGSPCRKPGKQCKKGYCLRAPFTIEAQWTQTDDHATFLFVPPEDGATGPAPYIDDYCNPIDSSCDGDAYPFACVNQNVKTTGAEVTTISHLLPGKYEYWMGLDLEAAAGAVSVVLKDDSGRVVRQWASPARTQTGQSWHVFDIDGRHGRVTSIDEQIDGGPPQQVNEPSTNVCTFDA